MAIKKDRELVEQEEEIMDEFTDDKNPESLKAFEGDILSAILNAANFKEAEEETRKIRIIRNKVVLLEFNIRPLTEEEYEKCRTQNTKYVRNPRIGVKVPESTNQVRYRSQLIYTATVETDRKRIWDNKEAWERLNVATGVDIIDMVLKGGEKEAVVAQIDKLSGYGSDELEETTKN